MIIVLQEYLKDGGYEYAGETTDTSFVDNDDGEGLVQGFNYCYRIVASLLMEHKVILQKKNVNHWNLAFLLLPMYRF